MSEEACWRMDYCVEKTVRARKPRSCCACRRTIEAGQLYRRTKHCVDGVPGLTDRCGACEFTFRHLVELCHASPYNLGVDLALGCGEAYENEWGEVPPEIARLPFLTDAEASALLERAPRDGDGGDEGAEGG